MQVFGTFGSEGPHDTTFGHRGRVGSVAARYDYNARYELYSMATSHRLLTRLTHDSRESERPRAINPLTPPDSSVRLVILTHPRRHGAGLVQSACGPDSAQRRSIGPGPRAGRPTTAELTINNGELWLCTRGSKISVHFFANAVHELNSKQPKQFSEEFVDFAKKVCRHCLAWPGAVCCVVRIFTPRLCVC